MRQALVLCSGGVKSAVLIALAKREGNVALLHFDWGQSNANIERDASYKLADYYGIGVHFEKLPLLDPGNEPFLQVFTMLVHALFFTRNEEHRGKFHIIYHGLGGNHPLCLAVTNLESTIVNLQATFEQALPIHDDKDRWLGRGEVELPLRRLSLRKIVLLGDSWGTPWQLAHTCQQRHPCHVCDLCIERERAFEFLEQRKAGLLNVQ